MLTLRVLLVLAAVLWTGTNVPIYLGTLGAAGSASNALGVSNGGTVATGAQAVSQVLQAVLEPCNGGPQGDLLGPGKMLAGHSERMYMIGPALVTVNRVIRLLERGSVGTLPGPRGTRPRPRRARSK